jgi:hypothetical protein
MDREEVMRDRVQWGTVFLGNFSKSHGKARIVGSVVFVFPLALFSPHQLHPLHLSRRVALSCPTRPQRDLTY